MGTVCSKCRKGTSNETTQFLTGSSSVSYSTQGKKTIQTTTTGYGLNSCVLCDDCIGEYVDRLRSGKTSYGKPIAMIVLSTLIGLIFIFPTLGTVYCYIAIVIVLGFWFFAVREVMKRKKEAREKQEEANKIDRAAGIRRYELDAKTDYMRKTTPAAWSLINIGSSVYAVGREDLGPLNSPISPFNKLFRK